jgi:hypothetical protein
MINEFRRKTLDEDADGSEECGDQIEPESTV